MRGCLYAPVGSYVESSCLAGWFLERGCDVAVSVVWLCREAGVPVHVNVDYDGQ